MKGKAPDPNNQIAIELGSTDIPIDVLMSLFWEAEVDLAEVLFSPRSLPTTQLEGCLSGLTTWIFLSEYLRLLRVVPRFIRLSSLAADRGNVVVEIG